MTTYHCSKCSLENGECQKNQDNEIIFGESWTDYETHGNQLKVYAYCPESDEAVYGIFDTTHYIDAWSTYVEVWCREHGIDTENLDTCVLMHHGKFCDAMRLGDRVLGFSQGKCIESLEKMLNGEPYGRDIEEWQ